MTFSNCHIIQFSIDDDNNLVPLRNHSLVLCHSDKYIEGTSFWGVKATPYGVCRHRNATHWGIVDFSDEENPIMLTYEAFDMNSKKPRVHKVYDHYLVIRNFNKYFKLRVSPYRSVKELQQSAAQQQEQSS